MRGINVVTVSQGKIVFQGGEPRTEKGAGRYIDRPTWAPYYGAMQKNAERHAPKAVERA